MSGEGQALAGQGFQAADCFSPELTHIELPQPRQRRLRWSRAKCMHDLDDRSAHSMQLGRDVRVIHLRDSGEKVFDAGHSLTEEACDVLRLVGLLGSPIGNDAGVISDGRSDVGKR